MTFDPSWYTRHPQEAEESDPTIFNKMSLDTLATVVNKGALSRHDVEADILSRSDSYSFQIAHPELEYSDKNVRLINGWLTMNGIKNPLFPDFQTATDALTAAGLLTIDKKKKAPTTFKSPITGTTYDSLDTMIAQERHAALTKVPERTKEEIALDNLPIEQAQHLLKEAERDKLAKANAPKTHNNVAAWLSVHPEFIESEGNNRLMKMQLDANGVTDSDASMEDLEIAAKQLRDAGLLTLNKTVVAKQRTAEIKQIATEAVAAPGTVFDKTSEDDMYALDLDELRRRADLQLSR